MSAVNELVITPEFVTNIIAVDLADETTFTTADKAKLNGIEAGAQVNTVTRVAGKTGVVELNAGDIAYDASETYASGKIGAALKSAQEKLDTINAGDIGYDGSATYDTGTVGKELTHLNRQLSYLDSDIQSIQDLKSFNLLNGVAWEIGTIDAGTGDPKAANNRVRTVDYIDLSGIKTISLSVASGYKYVYDTYNSNKVLSQLTGGGSWNTGEKTLRISGDVKYLKLLVADTSDGVSDVSYGGKLSGEYTTSFNKIAEISDIKIYPKVFRQSDDALTIISGYNIELDGSYLPVTYSTYCLDQDSYFKVVDGAESISMSGKWLYVRFYDAELNPLGNGGQATAASYTVNVLASNNPNLSSDAKWVKFGGNLSDLNGVVFTNLIAGKFIYSSDALNDVEGRLDDVEGRLDDASYRTILQKDMASGYIVQSNGVKMENSNYVYIENIPVVPGQKVVMTAYFGGSATNSGGISGWDADGNFKQRVFDGPINGNPTDARMQYDSKEITIPDGVYYIAFSSRIDGTLPISLKLKEIQDPSIIIDEAIVKHDIVGMTGGTVFDAEVKASVEAVQTVLASSGTPMLTMAVFTDLHHDPKYPNDPTRDMFANIESLNDRLHFDALMNLGDAIDGQYQTQYQAEGCLSEVVTKMYEITKKSHNLTGNHDDNVQSTWADRGNLDSSERLTLLELNDVLFKGSSGEVHNPNHITDYYYDLDEYDIRIICIGLNYTAYVQATQTWLENTALDTNKKVLVFSHCATKAEWGYMNDISNGSYVETPLNNFVNNGGTVIAFIHGHTHGDMIETDSSIQFTEVAIGCAKFSVPTSGTEGITYQPRDADDYTKILFDLVCVDQTNRKVHFIRCGAGSDRVISY